MKPSKIFSFAADSIFVLVLIYLLVFPEYASEPTRYALEFCAKTLIPSLFIYMVLAKLVITLPITDKLARHIGIAPIALLTGTLCGCPIGAKNAVSLYESGRIDKKHAEYLCSFTNNASISFVIGFVGSELFGDIYVGIRLFFYQLTASVVTAAIMRFVIYGKEKLPKAEFSSGARVGLREAVSDSAYTMLNLCACAVFFMVVGGALSRILALPPFWDAALKSVLEFSSGCAAASGVGDHAFALSAFSVGFTGFSVALQVRGVIAGKLSIHPFLIGKIVSCATMTFLAVIFG